jgi:hypothetical protein
MIEVRSLVLSPGTTPVSPKPLEKHKEAERRQALFDNHRTKRVRLCSGAEQLAFRRSTTALPLGVSHPKVRRGPGFVGPATITRRIPRRRSGPSSSDAPRTPVIAPAG